MNRRTISALGILSLALSASHAAENLALDKPYTLHPRPTYSHCTDPGDAKQLTDGVLSEGYFWVQKEAVGWRGEPNVWITIVALALFALGIRRGAAIFLFLALGLMFLRRSV